ncbi:MAG: hypothetical protein A7316_11145 [Candidatus Altiarchaeales archaeon WOR_SM1_86-2]|nr:MAG: hypothetical protein A7316_11145 [Candidatus Altiarchaeales archaeon WOR_SM1_86-2]
MCDAPVGIIFSAGVDSTTIALLASKFTDVATYTVGIEDSADVEHVREAEDYLKDHSIKVRIIEVDEDILAGDLDKIISSVGKVAEINSLQVSVGIPFHFASKKASEDGLNVMLCGQGADEVFGGYDRYLGYIMDGGYDELKRNMDRDVDNAFEDNGYRDQEVCRANGIELRWPYLDDRLLDYAKEIPPELKVYEVKNEKEEFSCVDEIDDRKFIRKYILRSAAEEIGVPGFIINRKKKAAQYGSGSQKLLKRVARGNGFKYVNDFLKTLI